MSATFNGVIFNDVNSTGVYDPGTDTLISSCYVYLYNQTTCSNRVSSGIGAYSFTINTAGTYTLYETVAQNNTCPPSYFVQPAGFTASTTVRSIVFTVTNADITGNRVFTNNFGHINYASFADTYNGYLAVTNGGNTSILEITQAHESVVLSNDIGTVINALGYNNIDNFLYAVDTTSKKLVRIGPSDYKAYSFTNIDFPVGSTINVGAFDNNGYFYVYDWMNKYFYTIDLNDNSKTFLNFVDPTNGYVLAVEPYYTVMQNQLRSVINRVQVGDWAYNVSDGKLYGVDYITNNLACVNPIDGTFVIFTTSGLPIQKEIYGTAYSDYLSNIYAQSNQTGNAYSFEISQINNTATASLSFKSYIAGLGDGAFSVTAT